MIPVIVVVIFALILALIMYFAYTSDINDTKEELKGCDEDLDRIDDDIDLVVEAANENAKILEDTIADLYDQLNKQADYISTLTYNYEVLEQKLEENEKSDAHIKDTIYDLAWTLDQHEDKLEKLEAYYDGQISRIDCRLGEMYYAKRRFHEALEDIDECLDYFHDEINTLTKTDEYIANAVKQCAEVGAALAKQIEDLDEMKDFIESKVDQNIETIDTLKRQINTHNNSLIEAWEALGELYSEANKIRTEILVEAWKEIEELYDRTDLVEEVLDVETNLREEGDKKIEDLYKNLKLTCQLLDTDTDNLYDIIYGTEGKAGILSRLRRNEETAECVIEELNRPKEGDVIKALKNIFDKFETN